MLSVPIPDDTMLILLPLKRPVMVWVHGGGVHTGSSVEQMSYDGANLCRDGDLVVVSMNHRLNILGYLDVSEYGEKYKNSANVGQADLIEALRWVKKNLLQILPEYYLECMMLLNTAVLIKKS